MIEIIRFFNEIGKLKFIKRAGWILGGVKEEEAESIADHSFRLALMSWYFAEKRGLDVCNVIKMSLIHDLCTVYSGDLTPYDNLVTGDFEKDKKTVSRWPRRTKEEKEKLTQERRGKEKKALERLISGLPKEFAQEVKDLWLDYEGGRTPEGRFVAQIDRVEKLLQATEYKDAKKYQTELDPFWVQLKELVDDQELVKFVELYDTYYYKKLKGKPLQTRQGAEIVSP